MKMLQGCKRQQRDGVIDHVKYSIAFWTKNWRRSMYFIINIITIYRATVYKGPTTYFHKNSRTVGKICKK